MPTIITIVLLNIGHVFYANFGLFYQVPMNSGALFDVTNVIDTYVYRALLKIGNIGMASAAGFYQSVSYTHLDVYKRQGRAARIQR